MILANRFTDIALAMISTLVWFCQYIRLDNSKDFPNIAKGDIVCSDTFTVVDGLRCCVQLGLVQDHL
jgi:hypothetical protein